MEKLLSELSSVRERDMILAFCSVEPVQMDCMGGSEIRSSDGS